MSNGVGSGLRFLMATLMLLSSFVVCHARRHVESLPTVSEVVGGYENVDSIKSRMLASGMHSIEGIWQFPDDGAKIAIERMESGDVVRYRMVIVRSPRRSVVAGTVMGIVAPTSRKGVYKASVYTATYGAGRLTAGRGYTLKLTDNSRLTMTPDHGLRLKVNMWRLIPYLSNTVALRLQTRDNDSADDEGCVRIFPTPTVGINGPRYL